MPDDAALGLTLAPVRCLRFTLSEPVILELLLTNRSPAPFSVNRRLLLNHPSAPETVCDVAVEVLGPSGSVTLRDSSVNAGARTAADYVELAPGSTLAATIEPTFVESLHMPGR